MAQTYLPIGPMVREKQPRVGQPLAGARSYSRPAYDEVDRAYFAEQVIRVAFDRKLPLGAAYGAWQGHTVIPWAYDPAVQVGETWECRVSAGWDRVLVVVPLRLAGSEGLR